MKSLLASARCFGLSIAHRTSLWRYGATPLMLRLVSTGEDSRRVTNTQVKKTIFLERQRAKEEKGGNAPGRGIGGGRKQGRKRDERLADPVYGFFDGDHVFGVHPVYLALKAKKRKVSELLVQDGLDPKSKKDADVAHAILDIVHNEGIPVRYFPKHDLNMLCDNQVHQGFVLRAGPLKMEEVVWLAPRNSFGCVLVLDEVTDAHNLGALLRTAHFLKCDEVVLCAKNSAPLNTIVSKTSAGALELMDIKCVDNLMKFLDESKANGWKVIGSTLAPDAVKLSDLKISEMPYIVVLGNEGHGIRTNILKRCDELVVLLPGTAAVESEGNCEIGIAVPAAVDSLNVSVAGGILLHDLMCRRFK